MGKPRGAVAATGANGVTIAARPTAAGHDVTLVEQCPARVEATTRPVDAS